MSFCLPRLMLLLMTLSHLLLSFVGLGAAAEYNSRRAAHHGSLVRVGMQHIGSNKLAWQSVNARNGHVQPQQRAAAATPLVARSHFQRHGPTMHLSSPWISDALSNRSTTVANTKVLEFRDAATAAFRGALVSLLVVGSMLFSDPLPSVAADNSMAQIGTCLLGNCQLPLAKCVTNPTCAANLLCIQTCTGQSDEADCQIRCGDKFSNDVVNEFTRCAVSEKKCVPQRQDDGSWPVPISTALVEPFSTDEFKGTWYIAAGLNKDFDCFDCQVHKFEVPASGKLKGNMQWRIKDPVAGTNFVTRATVQEFVQDEKSPGVLYNHDNEFLHYTDDWYVLAYKPREYVLVYYRGSNDAWDGYGGAVVYTTKPTLDKKYYKEIDDALQKIGRKFSDFTINDNSCRAPESRLQELEADVEFVEARFATSIQYTVKAVEEEAEVIEKEVEKEARVLEAEAEKDVSSTFDLFQRKLLGGNR